MSILPQAFVQALKQLICRWLPNLLPESCLLCRADSQGGLLCPECTIDLPALPAACCPQCGEQTTHGERCVAGWLGNKLAARLQADNQLIIPLPLHADRLRERGFNQSAEIARVIGNQLNLPVDRSSVFRNRATPRQAELPLKERHKNVRGAFECSADLSGRKVLLIDDVMTTGATVNECARIIKLHGASDISVVVAARALKH